MQKIKSDILDHSMSYAEYIAKVQNLLAEGKSSTTDNGAHPDLLHYTELNLQRMRRLDKTTHLDKTIAEHLAKITQPMIWLDITEGWCGDAAQVVPVIEQMAQTNPLIQHRLVFRDEHPDLIDAFLTHGTRSIPKLIILNGENEVLATWGPRPQGLQNYVQAQKIKMMAMDKEARKAYFDEVKTEVQRWYNTDKTLSIQREISEKLMSI